jgi:hypothetical protein
MTEWHFQKIKKLPFRHLRFAFDHMGQDGHLQKTLALAKKYSFHRSHIDVLYNWNDTIEEFYYRIKEVVKCKDIAIPMKYVPLTSINRNYVGKHWTKREVDSVNRMNPFKGQISCNVKEFEYIYGKNATEFKKLLNYPKIEELNELKLKKISRQKIWGGEFGKRKS